MLKENEILNDTSFETEFLLPFNTASNGNGGGRGRRSEEEKQEQQFRAGGRAIRTVIKFTFELVLESRNGVAAAVGRVVARQMI